jgi:TetR/AcrR family transcriptional regulator, lmrAB and yxaGH operons repressor
MGRPKTIDDVKLLAKLTEIFLDLGFDRANIDEISQYTGLTRGSLYYRFLDGKVQMASEVLHAANAALLEQATGALHSDGSPRERAERFVQVVDEFYDHGSKRCFLNMFSWPKDGLFASRIAETTATLRQALAAVAQQAGLTEERARLNANNVLSLIQGSLILTSSSPSSKAFAAALTALPDVLLMGT